jgi:antitoxin YefM
MRQLNVSSDIVPVNEAKNQLSKYLKAVNEQDATIIITQHGKARGVLISPETYDKLMYEKRLLQDIDAGLQDVQHGKVYSIDDVKNMLAKDTE